MHAMKVMKKRTFFLALVIPLFLASQNKKIPYQKGEYCKYKISFGPISAGYGEIHVSDIVYQDEIPTYHIVGHGRYENLFELKIMIYCPWDKDIINWTTKIN